MRPKLKGGKENNCVVLYNSYLGWTEKWGTNKIEVYIVLVLRIQVFWGVMLGGKIYIL